MSNPNKTAANFFARRGVKPEVVEARNRRFEESEMARDMAAFQAGEMSADAFKAKYEN